MTGKIHKFFADKGFGFIRVTGGQDHFFHIDDVVNAGKDDMTVGREVEFESHDTSKGLRAKDITV